MEELSDGMPDEARRRYHHGDLRQALIRAGIELIGEQGVRGLSLRAVARRAGVSHNAPYNHFPDKAALLAAIVEGGFEDLGAALNEAYQSTRGTPLEKVNATGVAYVRFALSHSALFRLMFRPEMREQSKGDLRELSPFENPKAAFGILLHGLRAGQETGVIVTRDEHLLALASWSLVHGLAELLLDGNVGRIARTPEAAVALAGRIVDVLDQGLEPRGDADHSR
jgi:AcrR family transcriptional regulator